MAGVIDPDFTGKLQVILHNFGHTVQSIKPGQRMAQLMIENASTVPVQIVESLATTTRGNHRFGSTETRIESSEKESTEETVPNNMTTTHIDNIGKPQYDIRIMPYQNHHHSHHYHNITMTQLSLHSTLSLPPPKLQS
jgi:hypothetical protein